MLNSNFPARSLALTILACSIPAGAHAAADPKGVWLNDTGRGAVEIKDCGTALCGHVVWVKDGTDAKGCGKQIIGEARRAGGANWGNGWIYSPEKKRRYDVELTPLGEDKLRVIGYAGVKLFSKTMIWKRAPADLQRCGGTQTVAMTNSPKPAPAVPLVVAPVEPKSPEIKAAEASARTAKILEVKAPETTVRETTTVEATAPAVKPTQAPASSRPAAATEAAKSATADAPVPAAPPEPAVEPNAGEEKTAQAAEENDEATHDEPADKGKFDLGGIDVSKFLKRTRSGGCKLDLPWVKIEFGCE